MAGLLDSITGFFAGPTDPEAIDPRYGITQQQIYDTKMQSLGSAGLTLLAAGQRMQPEQRAQLLAGLGNIPGQYQQGISQAMQQRLLASQLRSGEQDLAARESFAKRLAGLVPGAAPAAGAPVAGAMPGAAMPGAAPGAMPGAAPGAMPGAAMPGAAMPGAAARLTQPMPPSATNAAASAIAPTAGTAAAPSADLASLNLTAQEAAYIAQLPPSEQMSAYNQIQMKKLTDKPEFVEYPMSKEEIARYGLDPSEAWMMTATGPTIPGGRKPAPTNINLPKGPGAADSRLGTVYIDSLVSAVDAGTAAKSGVQVNSRIREMLDKGAFTGMGSDIKTTVTLFANALGLAPDDELRKAENSQILLTTFASRGLEAARSNAGQGAVSNYERDILQKAAGGGLEMTEANMRYIADITDKIYAKQMENAGLAGNILSSDDPYSMRSQWFKRTGSASGGAPEAPPASDSAPVPGAKKAPDGKWYVLKDGQYFQVEGAQ